LPAGVQRTPGSDGLCPRCGAHRRRPAHHQLLPQPGQRDPVMIAVASTPDLCVPLVTCGGTASLSTSLAHAAAAAVLDQRTPATSSSAAWLVGHVLQLVTGAGQVDLAEPWFVAQSAVMVQLLEFVVVPLLLVATIGPVLRQDLRRLGRV